MPPVYPIVPSMTTIFLWSRWNTWLIQGNLIGSNFTISIPFSLMAFKCFFFNGWLFEAFPKASNMALTSTPSCAFFPNNSNRVLAIESFLKLKYSKWIWCLASSIFWNKSMNFSFPLLRSFNSLWFVVSIPCSFK